MTKWLKAGMVGAHLASFVGNQRLRVQIEQLEARLTVAEHRASGGCSCACGLRTEERISVAEPVDLEAAALPSQLSAWRRFWHYVTLEADKFFNVTLAFFLVLCVAAVVSFLNARDFERSLDYFAFIFAILAPMLAGARLIVKTYLHSPDVRLDAFLFKLSALLLICGTCSYFALKGVALSAFYIAAGFSGFVFSSFLLIGLGWGGRAEWGRWKIAKAAFYLFLWAPCFLIAMFWAWAVSSEYLDPGAMAKSIADVLGLN